MTIRTVIRLPRCASEVPDTSFRSVTPSTPPPSFQDPDRDLSAYAEQYARLPFEATQVEYRRRVVLELLARTAATRVLEVGCGLEPLHPFVDSFEAWTIVEPAPAFARIATESALADDRITVVVQTIEEAASDGTLQRGAFDVVLLSSLLHEVPSPISVLQGVHALCGPETLMHVNVPNAHSLHRELAVAMGIIADVHEQSAQQRMLDQTRIFDSVQLSALIQSTGFTIVDQGGYLVKPFTHAQMQTLVTSGTIDRSLLDGLFVLGKKFPFLASEIFVNARRS